MKLKVPFYRQNTKYTCGPASLRMILSFWGDFKGELQLAKSVHVSKVSDTKHSGIIDVARREGFFCYINANSTENEIKHFLSLGLPVMVDFTEPSADEGHYAIVTALERRGFLMKEYIYFNDPWNGSGYKMLLRDFILHWHDSLTSSQRWLMVLSKEDFGFGKQFLPLR